MSRAWLRWLLLAAAAFAVCGSAASGGAPRDLIVFEGGARNLSGATQISSVWSDGTRLRQLTSSGAPNFDPALSPDGRRIAFERGTNPKHVWTMRVDGSRQRRLTGARMGEASPAWSPTGDRVAFAVIWPVARQGIWLVGSDGSGLQRLTHDDDASPSWSPDGTRIAFNRGWDIYVVAVAGGTPTRLTNAPSADGFEPSWSPDGTRILFVADRPPQECSEPTDLWVMNADGTHARRITSTPHYAEDDPIWLAGGRRIAYWAVPYGGGGQLLISNPDGTSRRPLVGLRQSAAGDSDETRQQGC